MRAFTHLLVLLFAGSLTVACSSDGTTGPSEEPTTGSLKVSVEVFGEGNDADGFTIGVTGLDDRSVPSTGATLYEELSPDVYVVELSGVAANCSAMFGDSRRIGVPVGRTTEVSFAVWCEPIP